MNLSFADRDFYYGDPYFSPDQPIKGLLSKEYAKERSKLINWQHNDAKIGPGDPYPYEGKTNPYKEMMKQKGLLTDNADTIINSTDPLALSDSQVSPKGRDFEP